MKHRGLRRPNSALFIIYLATKLYLFSPSIPSFKREVVPHWIPKSVAANMTAKHKY